MTARNENERKDERAMERVQRMLDEREANGETRITDSVLAQVADIMRQEGLIR